MPPPVWLGAAIQAGGSLLGNVMNGVSNRFSQNRADKNYQRERNDNLKFWRMQNRYNSPSSQRARLMSAGLNPALMYGQSASTGNAGAIPSAKTSDGNSGGYDTSGLSESGNTYMHNLYDFRIKQQTADNLAAQNDVIKAEALLKATQTANLSQNTDTSIFDLSQKKALKTVSLDAARESLRKQQINNNLSLKKYELEAAKNASDLREATERILNLRATRANTKLEASKLRQTIKSIQNSNVLQELEIELKKAGIYPNDPAYMRVITQLANGENPPSILEALTKWWKGN